MPRPHTVLWVDDEVESLGAHILFLEEQGYEVEQAAHGDDAIALLRRRSYGIILLDEQMPGRRGLELVEEFRAIDPAIPVVMVTKSEESATMRDAIGIELADYLVKPVNPRQVLTVVTRLLEGDRIRQQQGWGPDGHECRLDGDGLARASARGRRSDEISGRHRHARDAVARVADPHLQRHR